ncbi:MAG: hypothetical protein H6597_00175 [Flavobacteriales bacterium]|nr:hypothetical protein [Flavobacteriales bacterium]MCB9192921.1 hypothetical protein [Flavobacteriales bacterium]
MFPSPLHRALLVIGMLGIALLFACRKDEQGGVPYTQVDFTINVNNPAYVDIQVPGGWLYLTGGSQGILVYRKSQDEFMAYDRHCPYQPANDCRVSVDSTEVIARDADCCGSAFLILDGSVTQGPAATCLQQYHTLFNGTSLRIYN